MTDITRNLKWARVDLTKYNLSFCNKCPEIFEDVECLEAHIRMIHPLPKRHKPVEDESICLFCRVVPVCRFTLTEGL